MLSADIPSGSARPRILNRQAGQRAAGWSRNASRRPHPARSPRSARPRRLQLPLCFLDASCHASLSDHPGRRRMRGLVPSPREGARVLAMHLRLSRTPSVPRTIRSAGLSASGIAALLRMSAYQRLKHADAFFYPVPHGGNDGLGMADVRVCLRMDRKPLSPRTSMAEPDRPRRYPPGKLPA